jgi:hypothetical protein
LQAGPNCPWHSSGRQSFSCPLFVFLPKLIQRGMKADTDMAIDAFGKNEQVKKVFWILFVTMAGLVLARVVDPVIAQQSVGVITGKGGK